MLLRGDEAGVRDRQQLREPALFSGSSDHRGLCLQMKCRDQLLFLGNGRLGRLEALHSLGEGALGAMEVGRSLRQRDFGSLKLASSLCLKLLVGCEAPLHATELACSCSEHGPRGLQLSSGFGLQRLNHYQSCFGAFEGCRSI